jgi:uncharacterized protein YndB with AHSA1/START domain
MHDSDAFDPSAGDDVRILREDGDTWGLIIVRQLRHAPELVWEALTDPAQLREWAPFDADGTLAVAGATVKLSTVNAGATMESETIVLRAEVPRLLVYRWGGNDIRWELEPNGAGTRLTLWTRIDRRYIAMGAAGWHLCFDVLDRLLAGAPIGRIVGRAALESPEWRRLHETYGKRFAEE